MNTDRDPTDVHETELAVHEYCMGNWPSIGFVGSMVALGVLHTDERKNIKVQRCVFLELQNGNRVFVCEDGTVL